jgi:hypothetical protein
MLLGKTIFERAAIVVALGLGGIASFGQTGPSSPLLETGQILHSGRQMAFRIRNLPVSSFPELPDSIADALNRRGCVVPQSFSAHHPENVVRGSFERAGSADWAVLCSAEGRVSLLVFFAGGAAEPVVLATFAKAERLQPHDLTGELGFNWAIDPAMPRRVHEAQAGMAHRPASPDHDAVADSTLDGKTIYRLFRNGGWEVVDTE